MSIEDYSEIVQQYWNEDVVKEFEKLSPEDYYEWIRESVNLMNNGKISQGEYILRVSLINETQ